MFEGPESMFDEAGSKFEWPGGMFPGPRKIFEGPRSILKGARSMFQGPRSMIQGTKSIFEWPWNIFGRGIEIFLCMFEGFGEGLKGSEAYLTHLMGVHVSEATYKCNAVHLMLFQMQSGNINKNACPFFLCSESKIFPVSAGLNWTPAKF